MDRRRRRRGGALRAAALLAPLLLGGLGACGQDEPRGEAPVPDAVGFQDSAQSSVSWWIDRYGAADARDPMIERARRVFGRLLEASGSRATLTVVEATEAPYALAIRSEDVLLTRAALDLCYHGVPAETGDTLLAFVLAHELSHLQNRDFWHALAFTAMLRAEVDPGLPAKNRRHLELKADEGGAVLLTLAGYDPAVLLEGGQEFFERWVDDVGRAAGDDPGHPTPRKRAEFLRERLAEVAAKVPLFEEGVELYESGRFQEAIERFEELRSVFPDRAVLNDLALARYQLAVAELYRCDEHLVLRYRLPTAIDPKTLAERFRRRGPAAGPDRSPCLGEPVYRQHIDAAVESLEEAVDQAPGYLPARLNLVAALVLDEEPAGALVAAGEAVTLQPDDPRTANARAVAHAAYMELQGANDPAEAADGADPAETTRYFPEARRRFPGDPALAYNHAAVLTRAGRLDEARPIWEELLELEPVSPWASVAREKLTGEAHEPPPVTSSQRAEALSRSSGRSSSSR
jgi:tetratricopeptide (TPR) repeat protein